MLVAERNLWALTNADDAGNTITKTSSGNSYDSHATMDNVVAVSVQATSTNQHKRVGLTSNLADSHTYPNGAYIGLFPSARVYVPGGTDSTYTTSDVFKVQLEGSQITAYKNGAALHSWPVSGGSMGAKLYFYQQGASLNVVGVERGPISNPTPSTTPYCLQIVTGTGQYDHGTIAVHVDVGSGFVNIVDGWIIRDGGSTVYSGCFASAISALQVTGRTTNAWAGAISYP